MKKVCIVGAGAIGSAIGTRLAAAGHCEVSAVARGKTRVALQQHGWRLQTTSGLVQSAAQASDNPKDLGHQDVIFIVVKGPSLAEVAVRIAPLIGRDTIIVPAMNGVPWWFCHGTPGFEGASLLSVDPGGDIGRALPFASIVGCVVHASAAQVEPGLVQEKMWQTIIIGEPTGGESERSRALGDLLMASGLEAKTSPDVRSEIWYKLWGNMTMNAVSTLTSATIDKILGDPLVREFCSTAMREAAAIGARIGCRIDQTPDDRHEVTAELGAFKTSMLQDAEAGRAIELDALVSAVHEIGRRLDIPTPTIDGLLGLTRLFGRERGLYPNYVRMR